MLANFFKLIISTNNLLDGNYVEVYAGDAGIAWSLLFEEYVERVHINDLNKSIYAFWYSTLNHTEDLCRLINDTPVNMNEWKRQRDIQSFPDDHSIVELGFSTFFLNRTNRSGIITGGVIGGKNQSGAWKIDARFNKSDLISRIKRIARYKHRIQLYNYDAAHFINCIIPKLPTKTLIYLDPPYYSKGKGLYENLYQEKDHAVIANLVIKSITHPWVVSYDAAPDIINLYSNYQNLRYDLSYSAQQRYAGSEIMFFSKNLNIPDVTHPAKIKLANLVHPLV
jgi:DNA adenine methylase